MKKIILPFLLVGVAMSSVNAQIKRNSFLVRTSIQHHEFKSGSVNFIGGDFGYFFLNNLAIGYHHAIIPSPFEFYQPGAFVRYYLHEKIIAGLGYKTIKVEDADTHLRWNMGINAELGYSYTIKKIFAIDVLLNYNMATRKSYGVSVGGSFFFNRREQKV
jgi:hypothetical protein